MVDYKEMYLMLFRQVSKAIQLLQEAQIKAEEIFLSSDDTPIQVILHETQTNTDTHNTKKP